MNKLKRDADDNDVIDNDAFVFEFGLSCILFWNSPFRLGWP